MGFQTPKRPVDSTVIWRYMGMDKLLDLFFNRRLTFNQVAIAADRNELSLILNHMPSENKDGATKSINHMRHSTYISCWTMKDFESRALWYSYLDSTLQGISIVTTVQQVIDSIDWGDKAYDYRIVDYRDSFDPEEIQSNTITSNTKSTAYFEESEVRFLVSYLGKFSDESPPKDSEELGSRSSKTI